MQLERWPWPVRSGTLGSFALVVEGQPSLHERRAPGRVIVMLKALVALGVEKVAEQQISAQPWPEADGDLARQNFKTTLHRLRKLIGADSVTLHAGRLSLKLQRVWVDVQAFERLLAALESSQQGEEVARVADEAIERYRGAFLPQERASWVLATQARIRSRFLRIIDQAAIRLAEQHCWREALACYRKAVEIEAHAERFYVGLMR